MSLPSAITPFDAARWRQSRFNPLVGLNAGTLTQLRNAFDAGYLRGLCVLGDQIADVDDTAGTVIEKRVSQVCRRPWDVLIGEDVPETQAEQAALHQACLKSFYSTLRARNAIQLNELGGLRSVLRRCMGAVFYRYAASEIVWDFSSGSARATLWHVPTAFLEDTTGSLRFTGPLGITPGHELPALNWLFAVHHRALIKSLSVLYLIKKLSLSDWINFCEKFGTPGLHLETSATPRSREWNEAVDALASFARDWSIVTSTGQKVNLIQAAAGSGDGPFAPLVDLANRAMARVVLGSDLATLSREQGTGASLQGEDTDELIAADCEWLSELLNEQLSRRVIAWHFGEGVEPLAFFKVLGPQRQDTELEMKVDEHVTKHGVRLSPADLAERYGRTNVDTEAVTPAAAAANDSSGSRSARALQRLHKARFKRGLKVDLKPAQEALERVTLVATPAEAASAVQSIDLAAIEAAVMSGDGVSDAMEVLLAAEFLAGIASVQDDETITAENSRHWPAGAVVNGVKVGGQWMPKSVDDGGFGASSPAYYKGGGVGEGQSGDWQSLGRPNLRDVKGSPMPQEMDALQARVMLKEGGSVMDPTGDTVKFDFQVLDHWLTEGKDMQEKRIRLERVNLSLGAIKAPFEIWDQANGNRLYIAVYERPTGKQIGGVAVSHDGRVITLFAPGKPHRYQNPRAGYLRYAR